MESNSILLQTRRLGVPTAAQLWTKANHDLRQPLQGLLILVQALRQPMEDERRLLIVDKMEQALLALQGQMSLLTDVLKLDGAAAEAVDLACVHDRIMPDLEALAETQDIALRSRRPHGQAPSKMAMLPLLAEGLLLNALRLHQSGDIFVGWRRKAASVRLEVYFVGASIGPAQAAGALVHCRGSAGGHPKIGLGLGAIALAAEALGHRLEVTSRAGGGWQRLALEIALGEGKTG